MGQGVAIAAEDLAARVFRPKSRPLVEVPAGELDALTERLRPDPGASASTLLHALHLFGKDLVLANDSRSDRPVSVLDVLLDARLSTRLFDGASTLAATRYGVRVPVYESGLLGTKQPSAEAHPGQLLSVLAGLGIPSTRPIRLANGTAQTVAAIRDDLVANFNLNGEIAWDTIALAFYVNGPSWRNKFDRTIRFDDLARELMARAPGEASCGGTHDTIALTVLLKVDDHRRILTDRVRDSALSHLLHRLQVLEANHRGDGSWGLDWHEPLSAGVPSPRGKTSPADSVDSLIVTGHLLEWLMVLPEEMQPADEIFAKGARWLLAALTSPRSDPHWYRERYCPAIHATRSLRLLARAGGSAPGGVLNHRRRPVSPAPRGAALSGVL